jgi:hypothetical protein
MNPRASASDRRLSVALPVHGEVVLQPFPDDERFRRDIRRAVLAVRAGAASEAELWANLQRALQVWYPRLEIHVRDSLAGFREGDRIWYVLRDGRLRWNAEQSDRLYAALHDARATASESGLAMERAKSTSAIAGKPRAQRRSDPGPAAQAARRDTGADEARAADPATGADPATDDE